MRRPHGELRAGLGRPAPGDARLNRAGALSGSTLLVLLSCALACGEGNPGAPSDGSGGTAAAQGGASAAGGSAGGAAAGGQGGATAGQGGFGSSAGSSGLAGGAGLGGVGAGAAGGLAGLGGTAGGQGESGGSAGSGGSNPTASAGCGKPSPLEGESTITVSGNQAPYTVTLPDDYDPDVAVPLVFAFHGRGRTHEQLRTVDASQIQTQLGGTAAMAYLKSQGGTGWEQGAELALNIEFYELAYEKMLADYCIDTSSVFVVGHSSGASFANILACRYGDDLRGVGAVAGVHPESNCTGKVAAMVIHGTMDNQVNYSSGIAARDFYLIQNTCGAGMMSGDISPCVDFLGCEAEYPVAFCAHTEPTYEDTNHGWPSFASEALAKFFFALP